jgi:hypothetical protein
MADDDTTALKGIAKLSDPKDYPVWAAIMKAMLKSKNVWYTVDRKAARFSNSGIEPSDAQKAMDNATAMKLIMLSVSSNRAAGIMHLELAAD